MRIMFFACVAALAVGPSPVFAGCDQPVPGFNINHSSDYFVHVGYIDNRVQILLNGRPLINQSGNGSFDIRQNFSALVQPGENTLTVNGYNEAYLPGWHDPNPGHVSYEITINNTSNLVIVDCNGPDNRQNKEITIFSHTYRVNY